MARGLNSVIKDSLSGLQLFPFFCLDFTDGATTYKYTTLDVPINFSGNPYWFDTSDDQWFDKSDDQWFDTPNTIWNLSTLTGTYQSRNFEFEGINYTLSNVMDDCTLRIDNLDSVLTPIFVGETIEGKTASVYLGLLDTDDKVLGTVLMFTGEVDSFELNESEVRLVIGSIFTRWGHQAVNVHPSSCRWKVFKGTECAYGGAETSCDRTYVRCTTLGNIANFGGFRWLPSIENKQFQWGPTRTEAAAIAHYGGYVL